MTKNKTFLRLLAGILCVLTLGIFAACGGTEQQKPDPKPEEVALPTKAEVVAARQSAVQDSVQGYDFTLSMTGDFSILGLSASLSGRYDGCYRYDSVSDKVTFKRTTSGPLLLDSTLYVFTSGDSKIKLKMKDNAVKKLSVEIPEEQNLTMVNLPVVKLVDSVKEANITQIEKSTESGYAYCCPLKFDSSNAAYSLLNQVMGKLETGVSFKGIDFSLNTSKLYFNIVNDKINDFKFGFQMGVEVKKVTVTVGFVYEQKASSASITVPTDNSFIYKQTEIQSCVNEINSAVADLKDDPTYALGLTAVNEFDPGWNKLAIKDSYKAKMYKNSDGDGDWFNHSYCYKAHSEADGQESYKYTLGNVNGADENNQGTWLISRKGSNEQTKEDGVTADTQFDFLTSTVKLNANEIDCIQKQTKDSETLYTLHLNRTGTFNVQQKIIDMINTNNYGDVIAVNNYFNTENSIDEAELVIHMTDGKITLIECKTELKYTPTGGDYTEYNVTLKNTVSLTVNSEKELEKASEYKAPTKVKGTLGIGKNLNDSEYYLL